MNIGMVSEHASPLAVLGGADAGGQNVHVAELSNTLAAMGHRVTVYTRRDARRLPERVVMPGGTVVVHVDAGPPETVPKDGLFAHMDEFAHNLRRHLSRARHDVVHAHFWMSGYATLLAVRRLGVPVVQTFHALGSEKRRFQGEQDTSPAERLAVELRVMRAADFVIATSTSELFELVRLGAESSRVRVVPCGVDLGFFDAAPSAYDVARRLPYRIVTLSRLVERKGIADVVAALRGLRDTELLIGGGGGDTGAEERRLAQIARDEGVAARVHFAGAVPRERVPAFLRSADVVVCTPWYEPFGIVPLEAMACAVPVVASSVGGLNDTVVDGVTGYHVAPRSPGQTAYAVRALLESAKLRSNFGQRGRRRVQARYTWRRIAQATLDVYSGLTAACRPASVHRTA